MAEDSSLGPTRAVVRLTKPFVRFMHVQSASGIVLMVCSVVALGIASSPLADEYAQFWERRFVVGLGDFRLDYPLWYWINDALMAVFFFVVGLEIKREVAVGELRERSKLTLPVAAAVGGAVVPATGFALLQAGGPHMSGWAIPMATDIAFVVGLLALLGDRVPKSLKVFLVSLAIADDLISVVIIALFFTAQIKGSFLLAAGMGLLVVVGMNALGVRAVAAYVVVGVFVWVCTLKSGVHPTIAGVLLGVLTPTRALLHNQEVTQSVTRATTAFESDEDSVRRRALNELAFVAREATSPLVRLESALHPWVAFAIIPAFALVNAAVAVTPSAVADSLAISIAACLVVGKPAGISLAVLVVQKLGWARMPVSLPVLIGAGMLAGIGFTMSLFVTGLSLEGDAATVARTGVLMGSIASGLFGMLVLRRFLRKPNS